MSDATPPARRVFRRQWHRFAVPAAVAVAAFGGFAWRIPDGLWVAIPGLCVSLLFCACLHGGLTLTREGIEWYVIRPNWRFRTIPWAAVRDVRKSLFGLLPRIRLVAAPGRYELWVWGTPRPDRPMEVEIWTQGLTGGDAVWDAIHQFWSPRDGVAPDEATASRATA